MDMSGLSQSSSNLTADSSPSLPSHPPSISPVVTTKHLLPTESQDDDNDDYMFMSPLTTDARKNGDLPFSIQQVLTDILV